LAVLSDFLNIPVMDVDDAVPDYEATMRVYRDDDQLTHLSFLLLPGMVKTSTHVTISHLVGIIDEGSPSKNMD